ncbi:beta-glucosidase [Kineococcus radiotolerans]|uniref:Exo-alpha-(1->6)-L-arabinopyranosidase n=1 Tax=Kineococcus radiotolerans (strain ATCC BAA-149 / DSM 14245 / SRS30216) TaxID=266940 RepID=A6WB16_KINRD|nr:glycoside hydrolase family 3 C-terminal domain-containing protein [Kineococcus radiotolerans]ABS04005.1 glycoside hydrolase family 3 domain protein [Kineococcus radiotolerans SRS30216 = ATCC BAA-149]
MDIEVESLQSPVDRIAQVDLARKVRLLSGRDFWATEDLPEAGVRGVRTADGPNGLRHQSGRHDHLAMFESDPATCFPPAVAVGSSWDPKLASRLGTALGWEAAVQGVDVVLGPGVNIKRSPLCGRNFEYYSEDPLLSGVLGAAFAKHVQAQGVGVSVKHFAANNQETNRQTISAEVDDRTLREIYLPAFERVVREAQPATVMAAYNKINGVFASQNHWLLTQVLRQEWGFDGVVLSDWNGIVDRVAALRAGLDLEMPGGSAGRDEEVLQAVRSGALDEAVVDRSAARVAGLDRWRADDLDRPGYVDVEAHHDLARDLAAQCAVLLRNEDATLPLSPGGRIAVIGHLAGEPRLQGGGSAHVNPYRIDVPLEEIRLLAQQRGSDVTYASGYLLDQPSPEHLLAEAIEAAAAADVAVVFAGLSERRESEGVDRVDLDLPRDQVEVIRAVAQVAPRTVVVLSNGGIVSLEGWHDEVQAVLETFVLGQGGGRAVAELLFGLRNPSGHLAESIPLRLADHASVLNFPGEQGHVRYGEGVFVGYRQFTTFDTPLRYPFGYGLSYTTFDTTALDVQVTGPDTAALSVQVRNSGDVAGQHVVQVYVSTVAGPVRRPVRELRAFTKIALQAGETRTVRLELPRRAFAYWDVDVDAWVVAPGTYAVQVCADAATVLTESVIELSGDVVAREVGLDSTVGDWLDHPHIGERTLSLLGFGQAVISAEHLLMVRSMTMRQFVTISGLDVPAERLAALSDTTR